MNTTRTFSFRPRARLISVLGRDLISDQATGLIELVKNSYDADATRVDVELNNLSYDDRSVVTIRDNGSGMSADDLENKWLSPAVDHKEREKAARQRTPRGRLPIGEKGVGRFAVHQLGHQLQMVTRSALGPELTIDIDWDAFDSGTTFLDDLSIAIVERDPEVFKDDQTGTFLVISRLREPWTERQVEKVQRSLRRLQSPHMEWRDFEIGLRCPDFPAYENLETSDIRERAHYSFRGLITDDGKLDYEYVCALPGVPARNVGQDAYDLLPQARGELSEGTPSCGPFYLNLYLWDRSKDLLSRAGVSRAELDAHSGVSLFRDGLRVLPYGEPGDDWLHLDRDRINDPSHRISNNQVIGYIEVSQADSAQLRDKTNREGLIDNSAFRDLRALVRAAISTFTVQWLKDRPKAEADDDSERSNSATQSTRLANASSIATAIKASARDDVQVELPALLTHNGSNELNEQPQQETVGQRAAAGLLIDVLQEASLAAQSSEREGADKRNVLLHLAATGMAAERVVHEFSRQVTAALASAEELRRLRNTSDSQLEAVKAIEACLGTLRNEFRVLAPYEGPVRTQRTASISVLDALRLAVRLNEDLLRASLIQLDWKGEDLWIEARPASLVQIFDNLLNNAALWLATTDAPMIRITTDPTASTVIIADNGPGISPDIAERVFEPFFSLRNGGRGLGLYITRELLKDMGACIQVDTDTTDTDDASRRAGAFFVITFRSTKGAEPDHSHGSKSLFEEIDLSIAGSCAAFRRDGRPCKQRELVAGTLYCKYHQDYRAT